MSFSDYLENEILDHIFGCGTRDYTSPTNIFVALSTADPLDDGLGIAEPVGNGYARVSTVAADWNVAAAGAVNNPNVITFPQATGLWGDITHFALFDASTAGNLLASGGMSTQKNINDGDTASFGAGSLTITLD